MKMMTMKIGVVIERIRLVVVVVVMRSLNAIHNEAINNR